VKENSGRGHKIVKTVTLKTRTSLLILIGILFFLAVFLLRVKDSMADFEVNYDAGKRILLGETLYRFDDGHYMFKYFPSSALLYVPLSYLPLPAAKAIWYSLVVFSSVFLFCFSYRLIAISEKRNALLVVLPPLILAKYFFREIDLGQINALVTAILLLMVWLMSTEKKTAPGKDFLAGCLWGLATALKPYAFIFFPYFIIKKKWRALLSGFALIFLALSAPSLYYGLKGNLMVHKEWYSTLSQSTPTLFTTWDNISLIGFFMKWTENQALSLIFAGLVIGVLGLIVLFLIVKGNRISRAEVLECAVLLICIPLVSPLGWDYTLLMATLGVTILVHHLPDFSRLWKTILLVNFFIIAFSLYDIMGEDLYGTFMNWSITTINFLVIVGYLVYLRARRIC
jgi:hypothetical protein